MSREISRHRNGIPQDIPENAAQSDRSRNETNFVVDVLGDIDVQNALVKARQARRDSTRYLRELANKFDEVSRDSGGKALAPSGLGVFGGLAGICAGGSTIATGGTAVPLIAAFTWASAGLGLAGAGLNIKNSIDEGIVENALLATLKDIIKQDLRATQDLEISLNRLDLEQNRDTENMIRGAQMTLNVVATANCIGSKRALEILSILQAGIFSLINCSSDFIKNGATALLFKIVGAAADEIAEEEARKIAQAAVKQAVGKTAEDFTKDRAKNVAYLAAKKAAEKTLEEVGEEVTEEAAKEFAKKAATEAARKATKEAAEEAAEGVLKTVTKITGGLTIGFGALSMVWEGRNTYKAYQKSVARTSPLGDCLREIADKLEGGLDSISEIHIQYAREKALQARRNSTRYLRELAKKFDEVSRESGEKALAPSGLGVFGGLARICAGAVTIATGGTAVPVIAAFTWASAELGVAGADLNIKNSIDEGTVENTLLANLKDIIKQDLRATRYLEICLNSLALEHNRDTGQMIRGAQMNLNVIATANCIGSKRALEILSIMKAGDFYLTKCSSAFIKTGATVLLLKIAGAAADEIAEEEAGKIAQAAAKQAVGKIAEGFTKDRAKNVAYLAAKKAAEKTLEEVGEEVTEEAAKELAQKAARQAARKVATEAAEEAAEGVLKTATKITGGLTVGFGALSMVWEGRNTYKAFQKSVAKTSQLGDYLREVADKLQGGLDSIGA